MENEQIQPNGTETTIKLSDNAPEYIKRKLATAKAQTEPTQPSKGEEAQPNVVEPPTQAEPPHEPDDNEVKAWKGRLNKEQTAHQETNQRLLAEVAARQKAEQEKLALEQQLSEMQKTKAEAQPKPDSGVEEDFTDEEWEDLRLNVGAAFTEKLRKRLKNTGNLPMPDVGKVVEEKLTEVQQRQQAQTQAEAFGKALMEQVPRFQALVNDSAFVDFANEKVIDFAGNTASALLNYAGQSKDLNLIPKIAALVAEFEQQNQPPSPVVTAPPSNKSAAVNSQPKAKPEMTEKDKAKARALARTGKTKELRTFLNNFE